MPKICLLLAIFLAAPVFAADNSAIFVKRLGGMEIVALLDAGGVKDGSTNILIDADKNDLERAAKPGALKTSINAFVVKIEGKTVLFDTGMPAKVTGGILPALKKAGLRPADIDAVVITHFHFDHVGGLLDENGKPIYPNAELYVPRVEVDKWSDPGTSFLLAYNVRTNAFEWNREILPGITALAAVGHTPGHTIFRLEAGAGRLMIIGDLIHLPGVQLANPDLAVTYDSDPAQAVASRKRVFDTVADEMLPVASMHIPFPGMGMLMKDGDGYEFSPLGK